MNIIETEKLTKIFGSTVALDNVSIHVGQGEIYGFLGLNGAGKTTAIKLLLGLIKPDSGSFRLFGRQLEQSSDILNNTGYLVETPYAYPNLTVRENLEVIFHLRGLKDKKLIGEIMDTLQLSRYQDKKARHLSLGNKQRLGLAKALMHKPKLLILDEPINGLDPAGIVEIREFLKDLVKNHGTTIFLSSHILSEIARLANRIGIVHEGKLIKEINTDELEQQVIKKLHLRTNESGPALKFLRENGYDAGQDRDSLIVIPDPKAIQHPEEIASLLVNAGMPPKMLAVYEEDLESFFLRVIHEKTSDL